MEQPLSSSPTPTTRGYTEKAVTGSSSRKKHTTSPKKHLASLTLPHYSVIMMNHTTNGYHYHGESPLDYYYDQQEQGFHRHTTRTTVSNNNHHSKSSSSNHQSHHHVEKEEPLHSSLAFHPQQQQEQQQPSLVMINNKPFNQSQQPPQAFLKNQKKSVNLSSLPPSSSSTLSMKNFGNSSSLSLSSSLSTPLTSTTPLSLFVPITKTGVETVDVTTNQASFSPVSEKNNYRMDQQQPQNSDLERYFDNHHHDGHDGDEYYGNDEQDEDFNIRPNSSHFEDDFPTSFENEYDHDDDNYRQEQEDDTSYSEQYNLKTMLTNGDEKHQEEHNSENLTPANDMDRTFYKCNDNDTIIIRSYNYKTDDKQVNRIFVEGIKSIVPSYLQTFYLFIHYFGIAKVFCFLSLFYLVTFGIHVTILKMLYADENDTIVNGHRYYSLFGLKLSNSTSTILYSTLSTVILCTSTIILVLCGLSKYVDYSARSYIYQSFKYSDMANIMKYYIWDEDNHFWVAELASTGEIVGTIGVRKKQDSEGCVELKRMSVANSMKRKGIATLMLNHLIQWSKEKGYNTIVLSTSSLQVAAVNFYQKNGFTLVKLKRHSRFLPTAHLTFEKHLTQLNSTLTPPEYISTKHQ
ncbi:hypothetical protein FDP41_005398 [Naegleria fowleri]|uniref:N-acetyltransferase domain-containing protein n=1 Tax=Naegleria fowleri TaxID=5763 RepID=A0A6A5BMW3_NAEFO|nr:uncharacterized protein FDP41_005398 [Naegleria fowleri]KAF0975404.1 hypothetical protein FDP41_005398 [Naegleria fowleri]